MPHPRAVLRPRPAAVAAAVAGFAWWATGLRPFTATAYVVVVGVGAAAMAWGSRQPRPAVRAFSASALGIWLALALVLGAVQLQAFVQQPRYEHPTLSSLVNTALDPRPVRAAALALWLVAANRLARR